MRFDGPSFYSYGAMIACTALGVNGQRGYITTSQHWSMTTSAHQSHVSSAIPHGAPHFVVPSLYSSHPRTAEAWAKDVDATLDTASRSREPKKSRLIGEAAHAVSEMRRFAAFFGLKKIRFPSIPASASELAEVLAKREQAAARKAKREAIAEEKRIAARRVELASVRQSWLDCNTDADAWDWGSLFPTELRIIGEEVETSRGARFPVDHAKRGLALVRSVRERGEEWESNGHTCHLGYYSLDRIDPDGTVHAGCHVVPWPAIERIAAQLDAA